jgi:deazaflavin-dependent oxidoreductase (nitroreductase family)
MDKNEEVDEMADQNNNEPASDLPAGLAQPALRALSSAGITRLEQFTRMPEAELLKLHGIGPRAIELIRATLAERGLAFGGAEESLPVGEQVYDSPTGWVRSHIQSYVTSGGKEGYLWRGVPTLLLTTRGRKSGKLHRTALIFGRDGENYLLVASKGGAPDHPNWYRNLVKNPAVEIQVGAEKFTAQARTATPAEKPRLWQIMSAIWPAYDSYQAKTNREIPLVILEI